MTTPMTDQLFRDNEDLRRRLDDIQDAVRALRTGEADAIVAENGLEPVYTLDVVEKPYRLLVEHMPQPAATLTCDGTVIYGNRRFADLLGRPLQSLIGKPLHQFVMIESRSVLEALLRDGDSGDVEGDVALQAPDGSPVPVVLGAVAVREGALGQCLMITDRTEQRHFQELRRTQQALRESERKFDAAMSSIRDFVYILDRDMRFVYANRVLLESWGVTAAESLGRTMAELGYPEHVASELQHNARKVFDTGASVTSVTPYTSPAGTGGSLENILTPVLDPGGEVSLVTGVSRDVTERLQAEEALKDADRRKDEFLATLTHELRNPLAPIRNAVQFLSAKSASDPELQWSWSVVDRQVRVMSRLLEDLLDVSRVTSNKLELRLERIALTTVLDAALETSRPTIELGGHTLTILLPPEAVHVEADSVRLAQVFANLLNNAAKYTEKGGQIWLSVRRQDDEVIVSIKDSGIGISPEMLPRIFTIFVQSRQSMLRAQGGLGIGLSLVRGLVELHRGRVEAYSGGPGKGSEFVVRLPHCEPPPIGKPPVQQADHEDPTPVIKRRVLIVDDNRDGADSLAVLLSLVGHDVRTAYDGEQAIDIAAAFRPDAVVLDIAMPKLNGYDACTRIRQQSWGRGMFLIAATGWGQETDRRQTREVGFDHHLVKPVNLSDLLKLLATLSVV